MVRIHAVDWHTAINVGLYELELRFPHSGKIEYRVRYWRWAAYAIGLSGILGLVGLGLLVSFDVRGYIASHSTTQVPGFSTDQHVIIAWTMVLFWGFVWPWLLIALHNRPLHRLVARIVSEVDASGRGTAVSIDVRVSFSEHRGPSGSSMTKRRCCRRSFLAPVYPCALRSIPPAKYRLLNDGFFRSATRATVHVTRLMQLSIPAVASVQGR